MRTTTAENEPTCSSLRVGSRRRVRWAWLGLAVVLGLALPALAPAQPARRVRVSYVAPARCAGLPQLESQLRARSSRIVIVHDAQATSIAVTVTPSARHVAGRVVLREPNGHVSERDVEGDSCDDVVAALALIAAVAVDPTLAVRPATSDTPDAATGSEADAGAGATDGAAPVERPAPNVADAAAPEETKPGETTSTPARRDWSLAAGLHVGATTAVSPDVLLTFPIFVEVARRAEGIFAPAARLRFTRAGSGDVAVSAAAARFTWTAASLDLCPVAGVLGPLRLTPCARGEGGVLEASGVDDRPNRSASRPWLSLGVVGRARLTLTGPLFVEVEAALLAPLVRDRFFVQPNATILQVPAVGLAGTAGLGASFW